MWFSLARQRTQENRWVVHSVLALFMVWGYLQALLGIRRGAVKALSQVHRTARWLWMKKLAESYTIANCDAFCSRSEPTANPKLKTYFGNRLMVLKSPAENGEKGVLFVMVTDTIRWLYSGMNLRRLLDDYTLVFEPSWSGYCHADYLQYTHWRDEIFVLSAEKDDFAFLTKLNSNLVPVDLGPCDWVDSRTAVPFLKKLKEFDIIMNSNWGSWKRHYVLFSMLKTAHRRYKVALIGVRWSGKTREDIEQLADYYGVASQITIYDWIPYEQVMDLTCRSRVSILLSLKEGSNRAIAESIFCNVPVVILSNHVGGIRKYIVPETGLMVDEAHLESAINKLLESDIHPRKWGLEYVSCFKSTEKLNAVLRKYSQRQGRPWTEDIVVRSNSPDSCYVDAGDAERLTPWNEKLKDYLR
jgi:glycosyltransferase involved in cell wall biosynthesis